MKTTMNSKGNTKGQMEMIGLVIIVIIVTMAILFYVSYSVNSSKSGKKSVYSEFVDVELANSFVSTLLQTSVEGCSDVQVRNLVKDCGTNPRQVCPGINKNSCQLLEEIVLEVINETFDVWQYNYWFTIDFNNTNPIELNTTDCSDVSVGQSSPASFPIPYYPSPRGAVVELGICG